MGETDGDQYVFVLTMVKCCATETSVQPEGYRCSVGCAGTSIYYIYTSYQGIHVSPSFHYA